MRRFAIILTFSGVTGVCLAVLSLASQSPLRILFGHGALSIGPTLFCLSVALGAWPIAQLAFKKPRQLWITISATQGVMGICAAAFPYLFTAAFSWAFPPLLLLPLAGYGISFGVFIAFLFAVTESTPEESSQALGKIWGTLLFGVAIGALLTILVWLPQMGLTNLLTLLAAVHLAMTLIAHYHLRPKAEPFLLPRPTAWITDQRKIVVIAALCGSSLVILLASIQRYVALSVGPSPLAETWLLAAASLSLGAGACTWRVKRQPLSRLGIYLLAGLLLFLALYLSVGFWPYWHHLIRAKFTDAKIDFVAYQISLLLSMLALLFLPFFTHGRFLPLFFHFYRHSAESNATRSGQLISSFALGAAIAHGLLALTLPGAFGNDSLFKSALFLLAFAEALALSLTFRGRERNMALASCLLLLTSIAMSPRISPYHFLQPFEVKTPQLEKGHVAFTTGLRTKFEYEYYKDSAYSSLGIANTIQQEQIFARSLFVNGQWVGDTQRDIFSELMLAHIPHLLAARQNRTALFGLGLNQALNAIGAYHAVAQIDVVEPSRELWQQRDLLATSVTEPLDEKRVRWHEQEAIPYLLQVKEPLDTMVFNATPPLWPGSQNLYTTDFYRLVHKKLTEDGMLFQWVPHTLVSKEFLAKILHSALLTFPEVRVFSLHKGAVGILASKTHLSEKRFQLARQRLQTVPVKNSLLQLDIANLETILADEILSPADTFGAAKKESRPWSFDRPYNLIGWEQARFERNHIDVFVLRREISGDKANRDNLLLADLRGQRMRLEAYRELKRVYCLNQHSLQPNLCQETYVLGALLSPQEQWDKSISQRYPLAALLPFSQLLKVPVRFGRKEKKQLDESLRGLRQFNGPLVQFPREEVIKWFESCAKTVAKKDPLYGECLFHRLFFEDERGVPVQKLIPLANQYLDWFKTLPLNTENYSTFAAVKKMLVRWSE